MFEATPINHRNRRVEQGMRAAFLLMTLLLVTPVLIILGVLVVRGGPMLSYDFLFTEPTNGMTAA